MPFDAQIDRRKLLGFSIGALAAGIASAVTAIFGRYLAGSASLQGLEGPTAVPLGIPPGATCGPDPVAGTLSFTERDGYDRRARRERVFLIRDGDRPVVLSATCTHLGCAVSWDSGSKTFRCPCHGGVYSPDGSVVSGPPSRPLQRLPIEIRGGEIFVRPEALG
ncbi:MAG: ubiquinol-cytochrome c reductase iron-sulfur subunit [Thermoanaerobaculia bacterium]